MLRDVTGPLAADDGLRSIFAHTRDLGEKDLRHALALGAELGVDLPLGRARASPTRRRPRRAARRSRRQPASPGAAMTEPDERRRRGIEMMKQVYGWDIGEVARRVRRADRRPPLRRGVGGRGACRSASGRLVLLGLLVGSGQDDVVGLQLDSALSIGEMTEDELRELVVFLAHYAGWPRAAKFNQHVEELVARRAKAARKAAEQASAERGRDRVTDERTGTPPRRRGRRLPSATASACWAGARDVPRAAAVRPPDRPCDHAARHRGVGPRGDARHRHRRVDGRQPRLHPSHAATARLRGRPT